MAIADGEDVLASDILAVQQLAINAYNRAYASLPMAGGSISGPVAFTNADLTVPAIMVARDGDGLLLTADTDTGPVDMLRLDPAGVSLFQPPTDPSHAASKGYVDGLSALLLPLTGGTMTGVLTLVGDPTNPLDAATRRYVDAVAALRLPLTGGTLSGPLAIGAGANNILTITPGATTADPVTLRYSSPSGAGINLAALGGGAQYLFGQFGMTFSTVNPVPNQFSSMLQLINSLSTPSAILDQYLGPAQIIARSTTGTPGAIVPAAADDVLLSIGATAPSGSGFPGTTTRARIEFRAASAWNVAATHTYLSFWTTGSSTAERMRIMDTGTVLIGSTSGSGSQKLQVTGGAIIDALTVTAAGNPTITAGSGAPSSTQPNGSFYMRLDGGVGTRIYVNQGGGTTWAPLSGV